jgi:hypothetical protein
MASEFIKKYSAEWAAHWNYNYRSFGGTDPKRFFRHEWCLYTAPDGSVTNYEDIVNEKFGASKKAGFGPSTQKAIDAAQAAHRQYQQDPVPQADGYSEPFSTPKIPSEVWKALKEFHEDAERESGTPLGSEK